MKQYIKCPECKGKCVTPKKIRSEIKNVCCDTCDGWGEIEKHEDPQEMVA